jgi:molybdopterin converting factor small subunit
MISIKLQAFAWISSAMGTAVNQNQTSKKQLQEGATLFDLFTQIAAEFPEFKEKVFDPQSGQISDQVMIIANGRLIQVKDFKSTVLKDKDTVVLSPVLVGG